MFGCKQSNGTTSEVERGEGILASTHTRKPGVCLKLKNFFACVMKPVAIPLHRLLYFPSPVAASSYPDTYDFMREAHANACTSTHQSTHVNAHVYTWLTWETKTFQLNLHQKKLPQTINDLIFAEDKSPGKKATSAEISCLTCH
jgi:hypothetical protein